MRADDPDSDNWQAHGANDAWSRIAIDPTLVLEQMYESVVDFAIMTVDLRLNVTSWNEGARRIFGYEVAEVLGRSSTVLFTGPDIATAQPQLEQEQAVRDGRAADFRWQVRKDGSLFWADGVMTPMRDGDNGIVGFLKILRDITARKAAEDEIQRLATVDSLTGLYNRAAFDRRRGELISSAARSAQQFLLYMIDLDRFKEVNDTNGHQAGDELLQEVGARLRALTRESDIVARIGGDEFALVQPNPGSALSGAALARKILVALGAPFRVGGREMLISASIGIAVFPDDASSNDGLLKKADLALYAAKKQGGNCYHYFTEALDQEAHRRNQDHAELRRVERAKDCTLFYQPIVNRGAEQTVAMEALLRLPSSTLSGSGVDYVIALAKEIGLIQEIGAWVFAQACAQLRLWRDAGFHAMTMSVNTCTEELLHPAYLPRLLSAMQEHGLSPFDFNLELTERDAITLENNATPILPRLRALGFGVVLDDFGTGYSSLAYLRTLPVTGLKLDKSFLHGVPGDPDANAIAKAILTLAHILHLEVTAEGVEHRSQVSLLEAAQCDHFQGFFFCKPMSADDATAWLVADQARRA